MTPFELYMRKTACGKGWKRIVGEAGDLKLCVVDGNHVRTCIGDVDFALGGNHERYPYIPDDEVWAEDTKDLYETFGHEIFERALMKKGGSYEDSHKCALAWEMAVRGVRKPSEDMANEGRHRPSEGKLDKKADIQPGAFESRQIPDVDTQGSLVNPNPTEPEPKENGLEPMDNTTTSDQDDKTIKEPISRGSSDGGGAEPL